MQSLVCNDNNAAAIYLELTTYTHKLLMDGVDACNKSAFTALILVSQVAQASESRFLVAGTYLNRATSLVAGQQS